MELHKVIKALLISTSEGISVKDIQDVVKRYREKAESEIESAEGEERIALEDALKEVSELVTNTQVRETLEALTKELEDGDDAYRIIEDVDGYRLVVAADYAPWIRLYRNEDKPMKLSGAALETLALVAYRQPVTRAEMEMVRGVSVDSAIGKLLEHELVYVKGHANLPGKPRLYGTTDKFLSFCGIQSLEDLPSSDVLSSEQITEWVQEANKREKFTEQHLGLPTEEKPAEN